MRHIKETYLSLETAFDFFNARLFNNELPSCILTLQRKNNARGYFAAQRFEGKNGNTGETSDEIALNPDEFDRDDAKVLSTFAHEMCHLWQHHCGKPSRSSYHNRQWAGKMESIGLIPSDTGEPGGKSTGQRVSHYIQPGGLFDRVVTELLQHGTIIHWTSQHESTGKTKTKSKVKYSCPDCGQNAWAKPDASLICGECETRMISEDDEDQADEKQAEND